MLSKGGNRPCHVKPENELPSLKLRRAKPGVALSSYAEQAQLRSGELPPPQLATVDTSVFVKTSVFALTSFAGQVAGQVSVAPIGRTKTVNRFAITLNCSLLSFAGNYFYIVCVFPCVSVAN
jgi:hypothetical protein